MPADETTPTNTSGEPLIRMYGGPIMALVPALVLVGVLIWLSVAERADLSTFWVGGFAAIVVGLLLTRTPRAFAESIIRGLSDNTGAVIITAYLFAGVFGSMLAGGGLVNGLLWVGVSANLHGALFAILAFFLTCVFAAGTGSSVAAALALIPVLYPVGVALGADPTMLAVAVLAGGAFGDNIAPISDTTITSSYTAKATMADVVKSRLPLSLISAAITIGILAIFGGGGEVTTNRIDVDANPLGLLMIIPFGVVIYLAIRRYHIIIALTWGILSAIGIGVVTGLLKVTEIFSIPAERGDSTGLIQDGIASITGAIVLVLFILALAQVLADSGFMNQVLQRLEKKATRGVRSAELAISGITLLFTIPLGANAPAILLVGPTIGRPLGVRHNLAPARIANLMDCAANTVFYMLPWHNAVIIWYATVLATATQYGLPSISIGAALLNPYAWSLLVVLLFSILTGWNRRYATAADEVPKI
ncbi:sodium:proton antiporter [Corynebacterium alimapuense]|uniref:Sodium:proton antiporter n=2 Tax=Corynebacterium alimapuense TaxID=1576874 RepID=A0A3M8K771_9CORY|nr:sodium:proton antiporter [Corynebacterium alimapuense]